MAKEAAAKKAAAKRAAGRAEARARGDDVEYERAASLDPALPGASPPVLPTGEAEEPKPIAMRWDDPAHPKGIERHPSGRPVVRYGPPPSYPQGEAEEELCAGIVALGAEGYTLHAICLKLGYPPSTIDTWAAQSYGVKLREAIKVAREYARGALEGQARDNVTNGKYNTALFGKLMASQFEEYRTVSMPLAALEKDGGGLREGMSDFEFERRLLSAVDRIAARRRESETQAEALPAPAAQGKAEE